MGSLSGLEIANIVGSIVSIIVAIGAVVLSVIFFLAAQKSENASHDSLVRIGESTDTLSKLSLRMLDRLTRAVTNPRPTDEKISEILKAVSNNGILKEDEETSLPFTKAGLEQMRVDNLITACYYCGVSNIASQGFLPTTIELTALDQDTADLVDASKNDFLVLKSWLENTPSLSEKIQESSVAHLYPIILSIEQNVKSIRDFYALKEQVAE